MAYKYILFDLDGTITDSYKGIANSVIYSLKSFGIEETNTEILRAFIGPPLLDSFMKYYGFNEEKARAAVAKYRERYFDIGLYECDIIDGAEELLKKLSQQGSFVAMATSKPLVLAQRILKHFDLYKYFDYVDGADLEFKRDKKYQVIRHLLSENKISDVENAVMVGDRFYDVEGARTCGIDCIGVTVGFGDRCELEKAGAVAVCDTLMEVYDIVNGQI